MLIDIIKLPSPVGIPISRRVTLKQVSKNHIPLCDSINTFYWPIDPDQPDEISVGALIDQYIPDLYKAIHVCPREKVVFETVFMDTGKFDICLWTKIIHPGVSSDFDCEVLVSVGGLRLITGDDSYESISNFIRSNCPFPSNRVWSESVIAPPVFGQESLFDYLMQLTRDYDVGSSNRHYNSHLKDIYKTAPSVLSALVSGAFLRSPFKELRGYHPDINIDRPKWSLWEEMSHRQNTTNCELFINYSNFDDVIMMIVGLCPFNFSIMSPIADCATTCVERWIFQKYSNPYKFILDDGANPVGIVSSLKFIFREVEKVFFSIISERRMRVSKTANITITKNNREEISFLFQDTSNNIHWCFYTSIPILMMTTQAIGRV